MNSKRNLIITGIVGIAVVLGFVAMRGVKAPSDGTQGAIGAANRYQTDQISSKDVQLQDAEIQAFLQSDIFHKLATNPEFRKLVSEQSFRDVASDNSYRTILLGNKGQAQSLGNKGFAEYLVKPATVAMVTSPAFVQMTAECNMSELLQTPLFFELVASALENKSTAVEFREAMLLSKGLPPSFVQFASKNAELVLAAFQPALLEGRDFFASMKGPAELLASPGIGKLLEDKAFVGLVTSQAHEELMMHPEILAQAFSSEVFNKIVATQRWSELEKGITASEQN